MDKRMKIKTIINIVCLMISIIALYAFVTLIDVSVGWRIVLIVMAIGWIVSAISNLIGYFKHSK